jgi:hypothetical protein
LPRQLFLLVRHVAQPFSLVVSPFRAHASVECLSPSDGILGGDKIVGDEWMSCGWQIDFVPKPPFQSVDENVLQDRPCLQ